MPAKDKRKFIVVGDSVAVTIPKPYRDFHGLEPGDEAEVLYDSIIAIIPGNVKLSEKKRQQLEELLRGE